MEQPFSRRGQPRGPIDTDHIVGHSKLLGSVRDVIRRKHYSIRTEEAYLSWAKRYILFHGKRHPKDMGEAEIVRFLDYLAVSYVAIPMTWIRAFPLPVP
jgi:hypothetical protein